MSNTRYRGWFAGVEYAATGACNGLDVDCRLGRHAAHTLHNVEHNAFGLQQRARVSLHEECNIARADAVAVVEQSLDFDLRVQTAEDLFGNVDSGNYSLLLDQQPHSSAALGRNSGQRGVVAVANIFFNGERNQLVDKWHIFGFYHRRGSFLQRY